MNCRILLCEDGDRGHRPVILRYVEQALIDRGIDYVVSAHSQADPRGVFKEARDKRCTGVHFLTVDGAIRKWPRAWVPFSERLPAVGTYYLFSNAYDLIKGVGLGLACAMAGVRALLVSDEFMSKSFQCPLGPKLEFLPDPWSRVEFPMRSQSESRTALGLLPDSVVFLMFGELSGRKGFDIFLEALDQNQLPQKVLGVCAGRIDPLIKRSHGEHIQRLVKSGRLMCYDRFVEEDQVSQFFYACDYVVCPYPRSFKVSSNTATRALAAGRPYITFDHGVIASTIRQHKCGLIARGEPSAQSLASALELAVSIKNTGGWVDLGLAGGVVAVQRECSVFSENLVASYLGNGLLKARI